MILCETRRHTQAHFKFRTLEHSTLVPATSWAYVAAEFAGQCLLVWLTSPITFVEVTLSLPTKLGVGQSWLLPASWIKFLTKKSLKTQWIYFAPHEDNMIQLLSTVRSRRVKNHAYGTLEGTSTHRIAVGHTIRTVDLRHVTVYTIPWCEASQGSCCRRKNFLLLVAGLFWSACILLLCPSKPMQSNFPSFLPVHFPFSISIFSVLNQGVCPFCLTVPYCKGLLSMTLSHLKVLVIRKSS